MASDLRVPIDPLLEAFGVPATVTRPAPYDQPIETTGIWLPAEMLDGPSGLDLQRTEPRRVLALDRRAVPMLPRGTTVAAPETVGGTVRYWRVDRVDRVDADLWRADLVADPDYED